MRQPADPKRPRLTRPRAILFRLAAVAVALSPFVLLEGALGLLGLGEPSYNGDPFVGFRAVHPLFVPSEDGKRYEIAPSRLDFFRPDSFAAKKPKKEFRIFCLGGSTVQGRPFAIESSFPTFLQLSLRAADPSRTWKVVNCGGVSYASYRLAPILQEVLAYEPDLIILYTGHNEFLEDRNYGHIKRIPGLAARPLEMLARTRTYRLVHQMFPARRDGAGASSRQPILADEVVAMLELRRGLEHYHRDDKWRRDVIEHFQYNLRRMVAMAREAGVPLVLANPVCNLRDCPPFKNEHREGLKAEQLTRWKALVSQAAERQTRDLQKTADLLEAALQIDQRHAGLHFLLAKTYDALGEMDQARRHYLAAKENDICPLRILEPMNQAILEVAADTETPLVDVRRMYEQISEAGIPGNLYLIDHVHPSIEGHQLIADLIASKLSLLGLVEPAENWRELRNKAYRRQLDSLDDLYYSKGLQRLEMLRCWTQGKAGANWSIQGEPQKADKPASQPRRHRLERPQTPPSPGPAGTVHTPN